MGEADVKICSKNQETSQACLAPSHPLIPLAVFLVLCSVYLLTYNGLLYASGGDEWVLFSMTESLVQTHSLETPQMLFLPYSHVTIGRIEPLQSILAVPLYWLALHFPNVGNVQAVMLFPILVTAATGAGLYLIVRHLGYSPVCGVTVALMFGLGSISWPYTRTFFREPLLAFLYVVAFLCFLLWRKSSHPGFALSCSFALILSVAAKLTSVIVLPIYAAAMFYSLRSVRWRTRLVLAGILLSGGLALCFSMLYFRRGSPFPSALLEFFHAFLQVPPRVIATRMYGLLLSPGKGLLLFSPVLFLSLFGLPAFWRQARAEFLVIGGVLTVYLLSYGQYSVWWGGTCWGPRFLVPVVPLLILPTAEVVSKRGWHWRVLTIVITGISLTIQLTASTVNYLTYCLSITPNPYPDPENTVWLWPSGLPISPVAGQLRTWHPRHFDVLWWHSLPSGQMVINGALLIVLAVSIAASFAFLAYALRKRAPDVQAWGMALFSVLLVSLSVATLLNQGMATTPGHRGVETTELREIAQRTGNSDPRPRVLVSYSNEPHYRLIMNFFKGSFVHYWYSSQQHQGFEAVLSPPLPTERLWLIVDRVHLLPEDSGNELGWFLNRHLYRYSNDWAGSGYEIFGYVYPGPPMIKERVSICWENTIELNELVQEAEAVEPGDVLRLEFNFKCLDELTENYVFFVHLVALDGKVISCVDGEPQLGAAPTSTWRVEDEIRDKRGCLIPGETSPGTYRLEIGFYDYQGHRLIVSAPQEKAGQDSVNVGQVIVARE